MLDKAKRIIQRANQDTSKVSFVNFGLTDNDIVALTELLASKPHIVELDVTSNCLTEASAATLASVESLTHISVGQNNFGSKGAEVLLGKRNLKYLNLTGNNLDLEIAKLIAERRANGVRIITIDNPDLVSKIDSIDDGMLRLQSYRFRTFEKPQSSGYSWSGFVSTVTTFFGYGQGACSSSGASQADLAKNPSVKKQ